MNGILTQPDRTVIKCLPSSDPPIELALPFHPLPTASEKFLITEDALCKSKSTA
jgi:hypothetical protein